MSSLAGNYVLIQFRPCPVTEEFVNIGLALSCDKLNYFDYRLIGSEGVDRISAFFWDYDMNKYAAGVTSLDEELTFLRNDKLIEKKSFIIKHLARPLESTFKCNSNIGSIVITSSPEQTLNELFHSYVIKKFQKRSV